MKSGEEIPARYTVHVSKDYLVFCSAHFITYRGHQCESLHGHNYRAGFRLGGRVDGNWYVLDFAVLKRVGRQLVNELDHKVLLPRDNPLITVAEAGGHIEARYLDRRYCFPRQDVVILPIPNTTAEMLARHLALALTAALEVEGLDISALCEVEVEVEESFGQSATYRGNLRPSGG